MNDEKRVGSETSDQTPKAPVEGLEKASAFLKTAAPPLDEADVETADDETVTPPISADMQRFIGRQLRAVYDDVAKQPVPDRFLELMRQLESKTTTG